jgi:hypothetical protein
MMGSRPGTLVHLQPTSIHGQVNVQIAFHLDGEPDDAVYSSTVAREALFADAQPGARAELTFVMGQLIGVRSLAAA